MPSRWRSLTRARSNSAKAPKRWNISLSVGEVAEVVKVRCSLTNSMLAPLSVISATILVRSCSERASRSML